MDIIKINNRLNEQKDIIISDLISQIEILHTTLNEKEAEIEALKSQSKDRLENNKQENTVDKQCEAHERQENNAEASEIEILQGKCAKLEAKVNTLNGIINNANKGSAVSLSKLLYTCRHDLAVARTQHSTVQSKLDRFYNYLKGKGKGNLVDEFTAIEAGDGTKTVYRVATKDEEEEETFGASIKDVLGKIKLEPESTEKEVSKEKETSREIKNEGRGTKNVQNKPTVNNCKNAVKQENNDTKLKTKNGREDEKNQVNPGNKQDEKKEESKTETVDNQKGIFYTYDWESRSFWLHNSDSTDTYLKPIPSLERAGHLGIDGDLTGYYVETSKESEKEYKEHREELDTKFKTDKINNGLMLQSGLLNTDRLVSCESSNAKSELESLLHTDGVSNIMSLAILYDSTVRSFTDEEIMERYPIDIGKLHDVIGSLSYLFKARQLTDEYKKYLGVETTCAIDSMLDKDRLSKIQPTLAKLYKLYIDGYGIEELINFYGIEEQKNKFISYLIKYNAYKVLSDEELLHLKKDAFNIDITEEDLSKMHNIPLMMGRHFRNMFHRYCEILK